MLPTTLRDEATKSLRYTMRDGVVHDWDCLEALLHRALYGRLGWEAGDEGAVLFTEQVLTPRRDREKLTALCFERFGLAGMFVAEAPVLALYSVGRSSGLVADVGHDGASVAAVVDGAAFAAGSRRVTNCGGAGGEAYSSGSSLSPLGGLAAERSLRARIGARLGEEKASAVPDDLIRVAKHSVGRVAASAAAAAKALASSNNANASSSAAASPAAGADANAASTSFKHALPDGTELEVTAADGIAAGEALVTPFFSSSSASSSSSSGGEGDNRKRNQHPSLAELLTFALSSVPDTNARKLASESLLVCGGGSNVPGLAARVVSEGGGSLPPAHPNPPPLLSVPDYIPAGMAASAAWAGGAILARVVFQQQQHVSRAEYDEFGPAVIHRKAA